MNRLKELGEMNITFQAPRFNIRAMIDRGMDEIKKALELEVDKIIANEEYKESIIKQCMAEMKKEIDERARSMGRHYADRILKCLEYDLAERIWAETKMKGDVTHHAV